MKEILKLDHIQKYYGNGGNVTKAIQDISFSVQEGEFVGIMGASGSGKTTLLNCISTIDTVSAGHIYLDGTDVTEINEKQIARFRRENLGFVFQDFNLLDTLTISENIALALTINKVPAGEIDGRVREMAGKLNITDILDKYPYQVSGGQKQRVGIARALASNPKVLLCDEATSALDPQTTKSILHLLQDINKKMNLTIVLITHQMEVVKTICDRVAVIESGDIIEEGPMIDVFTNPQHPTTKEFTKSVINAELPDIVKQMKLSDTYTEGSKLLVRISFIGDSASEPIISGMVKHFDVDVSIISGNTDQLKDVLFGTLLIEISGNRERIKNALEYLHQQHLKTEVIGYES